MNSAPDRLKSLFERRSLAKTDVSRSETHGFLKNAQDYMDLLEKADSAAQKFLCAYNAAHAYATHNSQVIRNKQRPVFPV